MKSLLLAVLFASVSLSQTTNPMVRNPWHNMFTVDSLAVGGSSISTPSSIQLITPTLSGVTDLFRLAVNTCPSSLEYGNGSIPVLQGVVGCTKAPDNSNLGGVSTGGSFYSFGGGGTANTPAVGAFFFGAPGASTNVGAWSLNGAATNALNGTGAGVPIALFGAELDINTASSGSVPELAHGLAVVSAATQQPAAAFDALDCRISIGISLPFDQCLVSEPGAAQEGLRFWPVAATASNSPSQPIVLVSRNSGGDYAVAHLFLDALGSFQFETAGGNVVLNPATATSTNSPEMIFVSYTSGGSAETSGIFGDSAGNLSLNPATGNGQTVLLNGPGATFTGHLDQVSGAANVAGGCALSGATSCSFTFHAAFNTTPICVGSPQFLLSATGVRWYVTPTTTSCTVTFDTTQTGSFVFFVAGNPN